VKKTTFQARGSRFKVAEIREETAYRMKMKILPSAQHETLAFNPEH